MSSSEKSNPSSPSSHWGLILGGSSGIGLASARRLAETGMNIVVVHRDRRGAMERIQPEFDAIKSLGVDFLAVNANALAPEGRQEILSRMADVMGDGKVRTMLHSIALGNLKPVVPSLGDEASPVAEEEDFQQTIYNMGVSMLTWVQEVFKRRMFAEDARVLGLTSEGNLKAWESYGAVSAAKCTLESLSRTIAKEFAPHGIRCNVLQPGVTETPALKLIPGSDKMVRHAVARNPLGRLTTPEDVAGVVALMSRDEAAWINGSLIHVDGGEHIS